MQTFIKQKSPIIPLDNAYRDMSDISLDNIKLIILDNDVTTFNTEHLHADSVEYVGEKYGYPAPKGLFWETVGIGYEETYEIIKEKTGIDSDILSLDLWVRETQKYFAEHANTVTACEDTLKIIDFALERMIPIGIVSNSPTKIVFQCIESLRHHLGTRHQVIDFMVTCDDVPNDERKPHPRPYEMATQIAKERFRVPLDQILVLEDSVNGVTSSLAAKLLTVARPMKFPGETDQDLENKKITLKDAGSHLVLDDFSDLLS